MNLSGGFYQIPLTPSGALKLVAIFTNLPPEPSLVDVTKHIPMVWTYSTLALSSTTNNVENIVYEHLEHDFIIPPAHPLDQATSMAVIVVPSPHDQFTLNESGLNFKLI